MKSRIHFFCLCVCMLTAALAHAQSIRQLSNKNGLSSSAVLSLCQDSKGLLWIGSCDGLNTCDGKNIGLFSAARMEGQLSGNLINNLLETEGHILWIQTNYGLDRLDTRTNTVQNFNELMGGLLFCKSPSEVFFVLKDNGRLLYYDNRRQAFADTRLPAVDFEQVQAIAIDRHNILWIFAAGRHTQCFRLTETDGALSFQPVELFSHPHRILWAFTEDDTAYFIDAAYDLYEYNLNDRQSYFIAGLKDEIEARGEVAAIIKQENDYYIGFKNSGLIVLKYQSDQKEKYRIQPTDIRCGIFCLMKDKFQDIVWVGTDGQGIYMYFNDLFTIYNTLTDSPLYRISNPVRALYCDPDQTLWIGTKGGGILRIKNYTPAGSTAPTTFDRLDTDNSTLTDNSVYCFTPSCRNLLWIGTEDGLNYYDPLGKQLHELPIEAGQKKVRFIHTIQELNDTTLWISTVGEGIVKVILRPDTRLPRVKSASRRLVADGRMSFNYFFTSMLENDSTLWFGNRGYGLYRLDASTELLSAYRFDTVANTRMANDIFAIHHNQRGYWLGTGAGLLNVPDDQHLAEGKATLMPDDGTIHGILEDNMQNLWYSTNRGIVCYNPQTGTSYTYNSNNGLSTTEFSDGACYKDPRTDILYFGGTNGFVSITPNLYTYKTYIPDIYFMGLSILGKEQNINNFLLNEQTLQLDYTQNFFQLNFTAIDYINGNNYSYFYKIQELNDQWIDNGPSSSISFANLAPGTYTLLIKYRNNVDGEECRPQPFTIHITPPWYLSTGAYALYVVLILLTGTAIVRRTLRRYRRKQQRIIEKINQQKKEEIYESKLRFFTNITHEFCTPLTLIYGPCEKILAHEGTDPYIRKYAQMIRQNTEKLNSLILELLEFRRLETGHKELAVQPTAVSDELNQTARLFSEMAENRNIDYRLNIEPDLTWNTDVSCFNKITNNLLSNAFKYTPDGGKITIDLKQDSDCLLLRIANSGKGIAKADLPLIFDRYKILDSVEMNDKNSRTGLGLAICKSMTTLLNGQIAVDSVPGEMTYFTVRLPMLAATPSAHTSSASYPNDLLTGLPDKPTTPEITDHQYDSSKQTIMIIDDDPSMLWFVSEIFVNQYNILPFSNADEALKSLEKQQPTLIISDVMMPDTDGLSFTRKLKQNKLWNHIPLILLSALHHEDDQTKGIETGADAYVTKPFNINYLEKIVYRLIKRENELKEYHKSAYSSFTVENGKLQNKEDQLFMNKLMTLIESHLTDINLSVELLAAELGYSTRQFYRKLKLITDKSPADLIKDFRIAIAEKLLMDQNLTIEEIIDRTGFNNRSTFYKLFSQHYGMPPTQYRKQQKEKIRQEKQNI